jgi:HSP20 family protein
MTNITRFDPFDITLEPFDDLMKGFFRPVRFEGQPQQMQIKMDVKDNDIHVSIDGNQVSISAEVKKEKEEKEGEKVLRSERYYGTISRSFSLGSDIDDSAAEAKYADGVLELMLPKKATNAAKQLTVH